MLPDVQATAFLTAAWEALAAQLGRPAGALPVVFEDVALLQAVPLRAGGAATLRVSLDARQRFQVVLNPNPEVKNPETRCARCASPWTRGSTSRCAMLGFWRQPAHV